MANIIDFSSKLKDKKRDTAASHLYDFSHSIHEGVNTYIHQRGEGVTDTVLIELLTTLFYSILCLEQELNDNLGILIASETAIKCFNEDRNR